MRKLFLLTIAVAVVATAVPAFAELQNVQVGGGIRIRGDYFQNAFNSGLALETRWQNFQLVKRPIGAFQGILNFAGNIVSPFDWDEDGHNLSFVEQRTRLNVRADFSEEVSAFIELDSYDIWGEDFRSDYITGVDGRAASVDDVEVYQAYVQAENMWGYPLCVRVGRQELSFGNEWLIGVNDTSSFFRGLSFDGVRATYATDMFSVDAVWAKLAERSPLEEDADVDLYGVYASWLGIEETTLDAYWFLVRDAQKLEDVATPEIIEWIEGILGVDDYDPTMLHTVGLRGATTYGAFDIDAEIAYQFGDAHSAGFLFRPFPLLFGDDEADYDQFGANVEVGYTFDMMYNPRVFIGGAYLGGEDNRSLTFWEWLNPFYGLGVDSSVSFNRLFSNVEYSEFLENSDLSNVWLVNGGVSVSWTEKMMSQLKVTYFQVLEPFEAPWHFWLLGRRIVPIPVFSFWTQENDDSLGIEVGLCSTYQYSEDLAFKVGTAHLFADDGLTEGNFNSWNGLMFNGGTVGEDDAHYYYVETQLTF